MLKTSSSSYRTSCLLVLALALLATLTNAAIIKVNPSTGADSGTCGSASSPCKSIGQAYANAVAGDVIHLYPGVYASAADKKISSAGGTFDKSGLTIITDPTVTVAGFPKAVVDLGGDNMFAAFDSVSNVAIKNIDIKNGGSDGSGAGGCMRFTNRATVEVEDVDFDTCVVPGNGFGSQGGTLHIKDSAPTFKNCNFYNSKAGVAGTVYVGGDSQSSPYFENCLFKDSRCGDGGVGGVTIPETVQGTPTWKNCSFIGARCPYGGTVDDGNESNNRFIDCYFEDSEAMSGGFYYGFSKGNTSFTNCEFKNSYADNGGIAYMSTNSNSTFVNCRITNATAMDGGAIVHEDSGASTWINTTITSVKASSYGGAVTISYDAKLSMTDVTIKDFQAISGGAIWIDGNAEVNVQNLDLENGYANRGGAITVMSKPKVDIKGLTTKNVSAESGGGFYVTPAFLDGGEVNITNCKIAECDSRKGGGVYVGTKSGKVVIKDTTFEANEAEYGSAIYTEGPIEIDTCTFDKNEAKKRYVFSVLEFDASGTVYVKESQVNQNPTSCDFLSDVLKIKSSTFRNNVVAGGGAAVFWETARSIFGLCKQSDISATLTLSNNTASGYGSFIATGPQKFTSQLTSSVFPTVPFSVKFSLVDSFNQQLGGKHTSLVLILDSDSAGVTFAGKTDPVGIVIDNGGEGIIDEMTATAAPGTAFTIKVTPEAILGASEIKTEIKDCPDGQYYNPSLQACQIGCNENFWGYAVKECSSSDIKRDVTFHWLQTNPDGSPVGCYGGSPLPAATSVDCKHVPDDSALATAFSVLASIGIVVHVIMLAIILIKRKEKVVKAGQMHFNFLIIVGDIISLSYIFIASGEASDDLCMTRPIIVSLGFTISFVAMAIKAWRIDGIFNNAILGKSKTVNEYLMYWLFAVLVDALLFMIYGLVNPIEKKVTIDVEPFGPVYHNQCVAGTGDFTVMIVAYKIVLLGLGTMYAWKTRNISKQFSEAKPLFIVIYNTTLIGTIGCGLVLSGQLGTDAGFIVEGLSIFICTTANIVLLILPRILKVLRIVDMGDSDQSILQAAMSYAQAQSGSKISPTPTPQNTGMIMVTNNTSKTNTSTLTQ